MTPARIKRGSTFRAQIEMEPQEWAAIWPWDEVTAEVRQSALRYDLDITADPDSRIIALRADTSGWRVGTAIPLDPAIPTVSNLYLMGADGDMGLVEVAGIAALTREPTTQEVADMRAWAVGRTTAVGGA